MQPSMEKMSSDLNVKKMEEFPSCTSCISKITWHTSLSPHAHALQQPQVVWTMTRSSTCVDSQLSRIVKRSGLNEHQLWPPKLRCQPLLLLLDTRLDTRTFYYYSTRTRLEVKNHYSQGPEYKWRHLVVKFKTNTSGATWWLNFELIQVAPHGG